MNNPKIKYGVYMGIMSIVVSLIFYFISHMSFLLVSRWVVFIIAIYFMYKSAAEVRHAEEGYLSMGEGFAATFVPFVIGSFILHIFTFVLMNYIDPSLLESFKQLPLEMAKKVTSMAGEELTADDIEELSNVPMSYGIGMAFWQYLSSLLMPGGIVALVTAAVMRKGN